MEGAQATLIGGRYRLMREIGRGGMGAVWLAVDEVLGRDVAVKRIGVFPGDSSADLARAQREARLAAQLNHPHVVAVYDFVSEGDEQWLVMEHVAGSDLAALTRQHGGLSGADAAKVLAQVAEALATAHEAGIVHRDVKPSNILVTPDGRAKLADFGVARAHADSTLTRGGLVTGSPAYLAPEVAAGGRATEASDVWSLGATLFHTLAGHAPYGSGENALSTMYQVVHEEPPRLPEAGWPGELLEDTMAKSPEDRWPMSRVRDYLASGPPSRTEPTAVPGGATASETAAGTVADVLRPASNDRERTGPGAMAVLLGLLLLAVAGAAGWWLLGGDPSADPGAQPRVTSSSRGDGSSSSPDRSRSPESSESSESSEPAQPSQSSSPSPSATASPPPPTSAAPTPVGGGGPAARMRSFVVQYVATALSDPAASWQQLTPRFQQTCCQGSQGDYAAYWNSIATASVADVRADPRTMEVRYVMTWDPVASAPEDEVVTLGLVQEDGRYLIDYEL